MPDSIRSLFHCHRRFRSDAEPRTRRSKAQEPAVAADHAQIAAREADDVAAAVVLDKPTGSPAKASPMKVPRAAA